MLLGIIADDLTGASDIAGFVAQSGFSVIQFAGIPDAPAPDNCDCAVISLKSRSIPAPDAVAESVAALDWLVAQQCPRVYFKYCSTFDSTPAGNIGPVVDALLDALGLGFAVLCPSLPVNGRTVRNGVLFVDGVPLADSHMRRHPLNPMTDSFIPNLMDAQASGKTGVIDADVVAEGPRAVRERIERLVAENYRYAVADAETDADLDTLSVALRDEKLVTGGSGLGGAIAARIVEQNPERFARRAVSGPPAGRTVALSGSCSKMTNAQTARYRALAPEFRVVAGRCIENAAAYAEEAARWAGENAGGKLAPLVNATVGPDELRDIQARFGGAKAAEAVEDFFRRLAALLRRDGFVNFISAGGETSGAVSLALGVKAFRIGPQIAPGVSWVEATDGPLWLAMKSGNFGDEDFFVKAQAMTTDR